MSVPAGPIVQRLDVIEDIGAGRVFPPIDPLPSQQSEEALHRGIVGTTAHGTHATDQVVAFQEALALATGELTAAILMQCHR